MRRLVLLTTVLLLGTALPASAKMPPFEMETESSGDTLQVTVTISGDETLIDSFDSPDLNGLLAVLPADQVDEEGRPLLVFGDRTDVPLKRVEPGTYQGSVTLEPGRWAVVPFHHTVGALRVQDAYPKTGIIDIENESAGIWTLAAMVAVTAIAWRFRDVVLLRPV